LVSASAPEGSLPDLAQLFALTVIVAEEQERIYCSTKIVRTPAASNRLRLPRSSHFRRSAACIVATNVARPELPQSIGRGCVSEIRPEAHIGPVVRPRSLPAGCGRTDSEIRWIFKRGQVEWLHSTPARPMERAWLRELWRSWTERPMDAPAPSRKVRQPQQKDK